MQTDAFSSFDSENDEKPLVFIGLDHQIVQIPQFVQLQTSFFWIWAVFFFQNSSQLGSPTPGLAGQAVHILSQLTIQPLQCHNWLTRQPARHSSYPDVNSGTSSWNQ